MQTRRPLFLRHRKFPIALLCAAGFALALLACGSEPSQEAAQNTAAGPTAEASADAAPSPSSPPAAPSSEFDLSAIPLSVVPLPAFPYLDWPESVPAEGRSVERQSNLDAYLVIAGEGLRPIEGRLERRSFSVPDGHSALEMRRHYEDRIAALGGVRVDGLRPTTDSAAISARVEALFAEEDDPAKRLDLQRYDEGSYEYGVFVVRTTTQTIWFVLQTSQYSVVSTTIEEKAGTETPTP